MSNETRHLSFTARIVKAFLTSKLPTIFILISLVSGLAALYATPREEEPQIVVPMADIMIQVPGASAEEVENLVTINLEKKLWEIDGVEYIYSASRPGSALVTVRFFVGQDRENSLIKLYNKVFSNIDQVPPGVTSWIVKPVEIDDVPVVTFTLYSDQASDTELRRVADEILHRLQTIPDTARSYVVGGRKREIRVILDPGRMASRSISVPEIAQALKGANVNLAAGSFDLANKVLLLEAGAFLKDRQEVASLPVGVHDGKPVFLQDVALVWDGPGEVNTYTRLGFGPGAAHDAVLKHATKVMAGKPYQAVTLAIAKRKGTNAVWVAEGLLQKIEELKLTVIPSDINVLVTRDYGKSADDKVNELVKHLFIAIVSIIALLTVALGWREALIVALAVPLTLAITLLGNYLAGFTINRVTLFALILSLGLLVDDPIVDVENIHRHFKLKKEPPLDATLTAVDEVRPPTILATFAVIVSFLPLFFVTGMMGPYMRPMPFNVPLAMFMSLVVAFTVTPWAAYHMLRTEYDKASEPFDLKQSAIYKGYRRIITPFLESRRRSYFFLGGLVLALLLCLGAVLLQLVPMKMLPFDNKNELLILVDLPAGTSLEETDRVSREIEQYLSTVAEVRDFESYVGQASPIDFNGLVRHYYLRQFPYQAEIRINLLDKEERLWKSHEIALRLRPEIEAIGRKNGANLKIVEVPPGPPVLSTLVAEVYAPVGQDYVHQIAEAKKVRGLMEKTDKVVDVDDTVEADQIKYQWVTDKTKAALHGISTQQIVQTVRLLVAGDSPTLAHQPTERTPLEITLRLPRASRTRPEDLHLIRLKAAGGAMVPLSELGHLEKTVADKTIYRKNLERVVLVTGEMAGRPPAEAIFDLAKKMQENPPPPGYKVVWSGEGEWKITVDVFRDLGLAFLGALIGIYILLVHETQSFGMPLVIMVSIPLTMIGIIPGFILLNLLGTAPIQGYPNYIFFTATGMIGMIALAGIVVRNSIILIDFIHQRLKEGHPLKEAIIETGAVRLMPIGLTAGAAMFGSWVITLDPVFSGLAWSFIFGIFASTLFTLLVVPMIYYLIYADRQGKMV
jgi:multidrug efflux pump subunit AcrB